LLATSRRSPVDLVSGTPRSGSGVLASSAIVDDEGVVLGIG
jgi:hypothetical protein